jgi:hypothetical protein
LGKNTRENGYLVRETGNVIAATMRSCTQLLLVCVVRVSHQQNLCSATKQNTIRWVPVAVDWTNPDIGHNKAVESDRQS